MPEHARHEHLICLHDSLPSGLASSGYAALQATIDLPAAHGTVLVDIRLRQGCHGVASISLVSLPPRGAGGCRAAPRRVVMSEKSLQLMRRALRCQNAPASPPGAPGQDLRPRHQHRQVRHHLVYLVEGRSRQGPIVGPTCFLPCVEGDASHVFTVAAALMPRAIKLSFCGSYHWGWKRE